MKISFRLSKSYIKYWYQSLFSWLVIFINVMGLANGAVVGCYSSTKKLKKWRESNCEIHGDDMMMTMIMAMMIMINCFCGMVDRRKAFSFIFSRHDCQRSSPSRISDKQRAGFEPVQNLSTSFVEWGCAVAITNTLLVL